VYESKDKRRSLGPLSNFNNNRLSKDFVGGPVVTRDLLVAQKPYSPNVEVVKAAQKFPLRKTSVVRRKSIGKPTERLVVSDVEGYLEMKDMFSSTKKQPPSLMSNLKVCLLKGVTMDELKVLQEHNILLASAFETILKTTEHVDLQQLTKNMEKVHLKSFIMDSMESLAFKLCDLW
jgi:hypothetical protein